MCVCVLDTTMSHGKTAEPIRMSFGGQTRVGPRNHVLDGDGYIWGRHLANTERSVLCGDAVSDYHYFNNLLLGSHTISVTAFCNGRSVSRLFVCVSVKCLSGVMFRKLSEIGAKFRRLYPGRRVRIRRQILHRK